MSLHRNIKGVTVDTYKQQLSSILIYVEGSQWITEYYSQVLNENNELNPLQTESTCTVSTIHQN